MLSSVEDNSGAGVASVASSQSTPSAAATASPIATVGGGEGASGENGKIPPLVANGASNHTISDANQATVNAT
eukprot:scaffold26231_cov80-Skeletonema_menzelii.AAC.1